MIKPITPAEAEKNKINVIPDEVIDAFNESITKNYSKGEASFKQKEVVALIVKKMNKDDLKTDIIFTHGWLDVEPIYESAGWKVEYDRPGFNETYDPIFHFKKKARYGK